MSHKNAAVCHFSCQADLQFNVTYKISYLAETSLRFYLMKHEDTPRETGITSL